MRKLKLFFACLLMAVLSIGQVWAGDVTSTMDLDAQSTTPTTSTTSYSATQSATWTLSYTAETSSVSSDSGDKYYQIGSGKKSATSMTWTSSSYSGKKVKQVQVKGSSSSTASVTVESGSTTFSATTSTYSSATATTLTFNSPTTGGDVLSNDLIVTLSFASAQNKNIRLFQIDVIYDEGGDPDPVLQSIAVSGDPTTTTYEEGNVFDVAGLVVTGTYDVGDPAAITDGITWKARTNALSDDAVALENYTLTKNQTSLQVQATVSEIASDWHTVSGITVTEHTVTPGKYTLTLANALWGTSYTSETTTTKANDLDLSGSSNDIQVILTNGTSTSMYITDDQTRAYSGYTLTFSVPSGYNITKIKFTKASKWGLVCASGLNDDKDTWEGEASASVEFTFSARTDMTSVDVTFEEEDQTIVKTLKSIAVSEMTTSYEVGDVFSFDGTCTATYTVTQGGEAQPDENKTVDPTSVSSPDMSSTGEKTVTVSYTDGGVTKDAEYTITVNEHTVTPGEYEVLLSNTLWGVESGSQDASLNSMSGSSHDIDFYTTKGSSALYANDAQTRFYGNGTSNATLTISVPTGYNITSIVFAEPSSQKTWNGSISVDEGTYTNDSKSWEGNANSVTFTFALQNRIATATVTYAVVDPTAPAVSVASSIDDVPATGVTNEVLDVTYTNITLADVAVARFNDAECSEDFTGDWLSVSLNDDKDIVYSVSANTSFTEGRTAYIQLTAPASNGTSPAVVKVIAVEQLKKEYVFASLAELLETVTPTTDGIDVTVTLTNEVVRGIATSGQYRNGVYFDVTYGNPAQTKRIELYFKDVPDGWDIGDKLSGTLTVCPWKVYNSTWELAPKTGWAWSNTTCTPKGDLQSIAVSGDATKTEYANGESFLFDGLVATATYENGYQEVVTPDSWAADPAIITATGNVAVTATVGSVTSDPYNVAVTKAAKTLESIAVGTASYTVYTGEALPKPTVTATYSEGEPEDVSALAVYDTESEFDTETIGEYTITVSYEFGTTETTTYTVTVVDYANSSTNPYTPAEALYITTHAIGSTKSESDIYVQGIVSRANAVTGNQKKQRYWISEDGKTTSTEFEVYNGLYLNGADFSTSNQLVVGDEVIVFGKVVYYNSTTPEFATGESQLYSLARTPNFEIEDVASFEVGADDLAVADLTITKDGAGEVTLANSNHTDYLEIVDGKLRAVAAGTATITANLAANGIYKAASTTFNVQVIATVTKYAISFDGNGADGGEAPAAIANQAEGADVPLPANTYTMTGYTFDGWKVINNSTSEEVAYTGNTFTMPASAVTLQAQWEEISEWVYVYDNNVVVLHGGTSGVDNGTITISETAYKLVKAGAGSKTGTIVVTVPAGATDLHFHAFAWGGQTAKIQIAGVTNPSVSQFDLAGESGASGSGNDFTLNGDPVDQYFHVSFDAVAAETEIEFSEATGSADHRFFFYGVNQEGGDFGSYQRPITSGNYGTICLPYAGTISGATLYEIANYENDMIYCDEITDGKMIAGRPYIFYATSGSLNVAYSANVAAAAGNHNGLHGFYNLNDENATLPLADDATLGNYILYQNAYWLVSGRAATIANFRAYIKIGEINYVAPAPGRRRVAMSVHGEQVATGMENVQGDNVQCTKVLIDGQLFILRGEKMYDVKGQLVK